MEREYFGCSYSGTLDKNFKVIWSQNRVLFKHLSMGSKLLLKRFAKLKPFKSYRHVFKSEGTEYCAKIVPSIDGGYTCDIYEKINEQEFKRSELADELGEMKKASLFQLSLSQLIMDYIKNPEHDAEGLKELLISQEKYIASIYCSCHNIIKVFETKDNSTCIPLQSYILKSWDVIQTVTRKLKDGVALNIDISPAYVTIDYSKFELAFFNLVKIMLLHSLHEKEVVISIKSTAIGKIMVYAEFTQNINTDVNEHSFEMKAVKYLFKKLNGDFNFYSNGHRMIAKGFINAEATCNINSVTEGRYIEAIDDPEIILKKRTSNRSIKLYDTVKIKSDLNFASPVSELTNVETDESVLFAQLIFKEIILNDTIDI